MQKSDWRGVFPALTTKFTPDGALDWDAMAEHLSFQLSAGVHGIVILGSLGENSTLTPQEKLETVSFFRQQDLQGRPLVVTVAERSTQAACDYVKACEEKGADGLMLLPPMGYPSDRRETLAYLERVAASTSLSVMLYNNPIAYGTDLTPEDFAELASVRNVHAIKESSANTRRIPAIRRLCADRYAIFSGVDDLAFESLALGAVGWIAGLVVAFPRETVRIYELMMEGQWEEARRIYEWFLPLLELDTGPRFIQQIKLVEELVGVGSARVRPPRLELPPQRVAEIEAVVSAALETRPAL